MFNVYQFNKRTILQHKGDLNHNIEETIKKERMIENYQHRIQRFVIDMVDHPVKIKEYKDFNVDNMIGHNNSSESKGKRLYFKYSPNQFKKNRDNRLLKNSNDPKFEDLSYVNSVSCISNSLSGGLIQSRSKYKKLNCQYEDTQLIQPSLRFKARNDVERIYDSINSNSYGMADAKTLKRYNKDLDNQKAHPKSSETPFIVSRRKFDVPRKSVGRESTYNYIKIKNIGNELRHKGNVDSRIILKKPKYIHKVHIPKTYFKAASYINIDHNTSHLEDHKPDYRSDKSKERRNSNSSSRSHSIQDNNADSIGRFKKQRISSECFSSTRFEILKGITQRNEEQRIREKLRQIRTYNEFISRIKDKCKETYFHNAICLDPISYFNSIFTQKKRKSMLIEVSRIVKVNDKLLFDPENLKHITKQVLVSCGYLKRKKYD